MSANERFVPGLARAMCRVLQNVATVLRNVGLARTAGPPATLHPFCAFACETARAV